jgi:hypothetical protein
MKKIVLLMVTTTYFFGNAYALHPPKMMAVEQELSGTANPAPCSPGVFLVLESGKLAGVDWVDYRANQVHTRTVLTQSRVVDATIDLRPDQTAADSSVVLSIAGEEAEKPKTRNLGEGAIYWSDFIASSVEQAVARGSRLEPAYFTRCGSFALQRLARRSAGRAS